MRCDGLSLFSSFQKVGRGLFLRGLVSSHSGNMSACLGESLIITSHGSMLGHLEEEDLLEVGMEGEDEATFKASMELMAHRAIYRQTEAQAIIHAHPPHAIALSFVAEEIVPQDIEGSFLLGGVPVLGKGVAPATPQLGELLAQGLKQRRIVMVYGHGSFAVGRTLEEAYQWTSALEESSQVLCLLRSVGFVLTEKHL